jgi:glycerol-3-phosphate acyltransferase PlsY
MNSALRCQEEPPFSAIQVNSLLEPSIGLGQNSNVLIVGVIVALVLGYLLGSIPTGYLVARARGLDIQKLGSGNIGATNVFRVLGNKAGVFVLLADACKGWLACWGAAQLLPTIPAAAAGGARVTDLVPILAGLAAVLGHVYTCWLHFQGGKGVATTAGVMLALVPYGLLMALGVWIAVFLTVRYVSLASIAAAVALPWVTWVADYGPLCIWLMAGIGVLAIYKHRGNIRRLLAGTESRVRFRRSRTPVPQ